MTCAALFRGGPADGRQQTFPDDEPPQTVIIHTMPDLGPGWRWDPDLGSLVNDDPDAARQPIVAVAHTYRRAVDPADDGLLWLYEYAGTGGHL